MTTPLVRPLTREILVAGTAYRVTLTAERVMLTGKGKRTTAVELTWDDVLAWHERRAGEAPASAPALKPAAPRSVLSEIARELHAATASLARADESLAQAGALPPELRAEVAGDPQYGRPERRDDWFIEPLLTEREVASILRLSTRAVRRLGMDSIHIGGQVRFRQSEIRRFLKNQESKAWHR